MKNGKLSKKDIQAIEKAVEKYNAMAMGCLEIEGSTGWYACGLCRLYYGNGCKMCPISIKVEINCCSGTPYYDIADNGVFFYKYYMDLPEWEKCAKALEDEIEFLISLLPEEHRLRQIQE